MLLAALAPVVALPWLQGFFAPAAASDRGSYDCASAEAVPMVIAADVAPGDGTERVVASYTHGVIVFDAAARPIARAPGRGCGGSADELVAMAAGDGAIGHPIIALAATTGGHNESRTELTLFRVTDAGELRPLFTAEVERHLDQTTRTGIVTLLPGGLVYRAPSGQTSLWTYDSELDRYVEQLVTRPSA